MNTNYDITKDPYFKDYLTNNPRISENTIKRYQKAIFKFSIALNLTLEEIVTTCKDEQDIETEEIINVAEDENGNKITKRRVTRFDVDGKDSTIKNYFTQYEKYCKQRGNKNSTINSEVEAIRTVLMGCGVRLPKLRELEDDSDDWNLLTKEDLNYVLQDATLVHSSLAFFLVGSGMRIGDALKLSIGDFMEATKEYHDYIDVEDFVDNAPQDMIGTYIFNPTKTRRYGIKCVTFNSADSSNMILQNLRWLKNEYYPAKSEEIGEDLKISKKDALFGSKKAKYKTAMTPKAIAEQWGKKNKKLREWRINQIKQKIKDGELSEEDYDRELEKIPRFHAHADKSYIKKSINDIKEIYLKAHDDLCLSKIETRIISDKETERLNAEIESLKAENAKIREEKDQEISNLEQKHQNEINELRLSVGNMQKQMDDLTSVRKRSNIEKTIYDFFKENYHETILKNEGNNIQAIKKSNTLCKIAYDLAIDEEYNFRDDEDYLDSLIKKAIVKYSLNPELMNANQKELINIEELETLTKDSVAFFELFELIKSNDTLWGMVKEDQIKLKNIILFIIKKNRDNLDNLTDEDKDNMVQEVLMEYLTVD